MAVASKKRKIFDDRYEILSIIGRGAQSVVYQARNIIEGGPEVALKVLVNKKGSIPNSERLRKEALAMVSCNHRYVIRLDDFHTVGDVSYLSMELAPQNDLRRYAERKGNNLPGELIERFFIQTTEALDYIHKVGIVHRDVKPDNILVLSDNEIRLGDFGLALLPGENPLPEDAQLGVGTLDYLPPEVLEGKQFNAVSDLYSLGICFYELVTGALPFADVPLSGQLEARKSRPLKHLNTIRPDLSPAFCDVIINMLRYNPSDRFLSAAEILEAMKPRKTPKKPSSTPVNIWDPNNRETVAIPAETVATIVQDVRQDTPAEAAPAPVPAVEIPPSVEDPVNDFEEDEDWLDDDFDEELDETPLASEEEGFQEEEEAQEEQLADFDDDELLDYDSDFDEPEPQQPEAAAPAAQHRAAPQAAEPRPDMKFTLLLTIAVCAIIAGAVALKNRQSVAELPVQPNLLEQAGIVQSESFESAIGGNSLDFTKLQPGIYSGTAGGVLPGRKVPMTLVVLDGEQSIRVLMGMEGWTPQELDMTSARLRDNPSQLRVASNGFILNLSAKSVSAREIGGQVDNVITGERGVWTIRPQMQ